MARDADRSRSSKPFGPRLRGPCVSPSDRYDRYRCQQRQDHRRAVGNIANQPVGARHAQGLGISLRSGHVRFGICQTRRRREPPGEVFERQRRFRPLAQPRILGPGSKQSPGLFQAARSGRPRAGCHRSKNLSADEPGVRA